MSGMPRSLETVNLAAEAIASAESRVQQTEAPMEEKDKGNDWEVVSLTASTYAAAPGPQTPSTPPSGHRKLESLDTSYTTKQYEFEPPSSMFMSNHFLRPNEEEMDESSQYEQKETSKAKEDELQKSLSMSSGFEPLKGSIVEESEILPAYEEQEREVERVEERETKGVEKEGWWKKQVLTVYKNVKEATSTRVEKEGWWKKQVLIVYKNVKEATTLWSVCWATALVGIAIVGQRWQREKLQIQQLKLQFRINNERISCMVVPFKTAALGDNAHNHLVHGYSALG